MNSQMKRYPGQQSLGARRAQSSKPSPDKLPSHPLAYAPSRKLSAPHSPRFTQSFIHELSPRPSAPQEPRGTAGSPTLLQCWAPAAWASA